MNKIIPKQIGVGYSNGLGIPISPTRYNTVVTFLANLKQWLPEELLYWLGC